MKTNIYLNFPGNCAEALAFYEKNLHAKVTAKMSFADMSSTGNPQNLPPGLKPEGVLHARFTLGDTEVMASDGPPDHVEPMRSAYVTLRLDSNEETERIYAALTEGGQIFMKLEETFFAHRFAQFRDRFGINWMLLHEKPMR